jgi:lysophospholipase L1-like esterase
MAITSINTLKQWFQTAMKPTQEQFWAIFDSFRHKSDKVPASDIEGMDDLLLSKADKEAFTVHLADEAAHATLFEAKVDKETGKVLSDQNFTVEEKNKLAGIYQWIAANVQGAPNLGALNPSMVPAGTGAAYWFTMVAGTYPNAGGVVVQANNLAVIIRDNLGSFTISQMALSVDLSTYATKTYVDTNGGKIKAFVDDAWPINSQVNFLGKDWYNTVATVEGDIPGTSPKWVDRLNGYLDKNPSPILKSCIVTGRPESAQTFYYLRITNSNIASEASLLTTETLKISLDVLSDDSNISGIAVFFVNSLGNVYSGTLSYGTVGSSKSYLVDSGQIAKNITGTPEIYIRVFYTDPTIISTTYLSNIRLFAGNTNISFDYFDERIFQQNDYPKSFFMPSLPLMNKQISISNDLDTQSFVQFNKWYKKKYNALGDSITEANGQATNKYYQHLLVWNNLSRVRQYGYSGRCIQKKNASDTDCMSTMYASMDDDADLITVFGGTNDWHLSEYGLGLMGDTTNITFYGALDVLIKGLTAKYPTKTIAFFTPLQRTQSGSYPARNLEDYANAMIAVCRKYSIPCLDLYHDGGFCPAIQGATYSTDGLHPNNAGHLIIAKKMYSFLNSL